jgi:hypothetical protein
MLAVRLVRLIENHIEQLSRDLSEKVWSSPRCSDLNKVPAAQLEARTREIYRNLSDWLLDKTEAQVERRYTELGAARAQRAWPTATSSGPSPQPRAHALRPARSLSGSAMELHGELELLPCRPVLRSALLRRRLRREPTAEEAKEAQGR